MQQLTGREGMEGTFYAEISSGNWFWHAKYINNEAMFFEIEWLHENVDTRLTTHVT